MPWLSIDDVGALEGNAGSHVLQFTVTLLDPSPLAVAAQYHTADNTATLGDHDYGLAFGPITFQPGQPLTKTVDVVVFGDTQLEVDETFYVNLTNAVNATFRRSQGVGTIFNDDSGLPGDFNHDGLLDCADVNALVMVIAAHTHDLNYDLTADNLVTTADLDQWLALAGAMPGSPTGGNAFLKGDANLDGIVDGQDFILWNTYKFTNTPRWCSGDFSADGIVDGQDFIIWNSNKFKSAGVGRLAISPVGTAPVVQRANGEAWTAQQSWRGWDGTLDQRVTTVQPTQPATATYRAIMTEDIATQRRRAVTQPSVLLDNVFAELDTPEGWYTPYSL